MKGSRLLNLSLNGLKSLLRCGENFYLAAAKGRKHLPDCPDLEEVKMTRKKMIPAVETFVDKMRAVCLGTSRDDTERWDKCRELLKELLKDPALQAHSENWPVGGFDGKKVDNLLFYEDPDHHFVINGLIKNPGGRAMIHDHGQAWTVYGLLRGARNGSCVTSRQRRVTAKRSMRSGFCRALWPLVMSILFRPGKYIQNMLVTKNGGCDRSKPEIRYFRAVPVLR